MKTKDIIRGILKREGESKYNSDEEFDEDELKMGIKVEKEHVDDEEAAKEIAKDHLKENPKYYTELKKSGIDKH